MTKFIVGMFASMLVFVLTCYTENTLLSPYLNFIVYYRYGLHGRCIPFFHSGAGESGKSTFAKQMKYVMLGQVYIYMYVCMYVCMYVL